MGNIDITDVTDNKTFWRTLKGTVMQTEKVLINDCLSVLTVSWKFCGPTIYNFAVIYPWKFLFFKKGRLLFNSFYCLLSVYKQNFTAK